MGHPVFINEQWYLSACAQRLVDVHDDPVEDGGVDALGQRVTGEQRVGLKGVKTEVRLNRINPNYIFVQFNCIININDINKLKRKLSRPGSWASCRSPWWWRSCGSPATSWSAPPRSRTAQTLFSADYNDIFRYMFLKFFRNFTSVSYRVG